MIIGYLASLLVKYRTKMVDQIVLEIVQLDVNQSDDQYRHSEHEHLRVVVRVGALMLLLLRAATAILDEGIVVVVVAIHLETVQDILQAR